MSKHKRMALMDDLYINVDVIMIAEDTYLLLRNVFKKKSKTETIKHMRNIVYEGKCEGQYRLKNIDGYKFTWNDESVIVNKNGTKFIHAFKVNEKEKPVNVSNNQNENKKEEKSLIFEIAGVKVDLLKLKPKKHFKQRARERFFITDGSLLQKFYIQIITEGEYLGLQINGDAESNDEYSEGHMFVKDNKVVILNKENYSPVTTYIAEISHYSRVKNKFLPIMKQKLNGAKKRMKIIENKIRFDTKYIKIKILELEIERDRTKSKAKKLACQAMINALEIELKEIENEELKTKQEVKDLNYAVACLI